MDWTVRLWFALIPIFGFLFLMVLLRRGAERQPGAETATYVVYGIFAVWLLVVVLMTYFRRRKSDDWHLLSMSLGKPV